MIASAVEGWMFGRVCSVSAWHVLMFSLPGRAAVVGVVSPLVLAVSAVVVAAAASMVASAKSARADRSRGSTHRTAGAALLTGQPSWSRSRRMKSLMTAPELAPYATIASACPGGHVDPLRLRRRSRPRDSAAPRPTRPARRRRSTPSGSPSRPGVELPVGVVPGPRRVPVVLVGIDSFRFQSCATVHESRALPH